MKRITLIILLLIVSKSFAHKESTHQYITNEAYNLLKLAFNATFPILDEHMHTYSDPSQGGPWQLPYVTRGAYREDLEDPVYNIYLGNPPTMYDDVGGEVAILGETLGIIISQLTGLDFDFFVSTTHFWNADAGDTQVTNMHAQSILRDFYIRVPNSYQKMLKYASGNYELNINLVLYGFPTQANGTGACATQRAIVTFKYNSLTDLFKNKNLYVTKVTWLTGEQTVYNSPIKFLPQHWSLLNSGDYFNFIDCIVFETLGRMCHLLQDASVPAHVHVDDHSPFSRGDDFESFMGGDRYWTGQLVYNQVGSYINPYSSSNPLHYLMYTTAQMADHFGSNGPFEGDGDNIIAGNPLSEEISFLNSVNLGSLGSPTSTTNPLTSEHKNNIRNKMIPQAIRATAGLLYWFANETNLMPIPLTAVTVYGSSDIYTEGNYHFYAQPKNGISPFTYNWQMYKIGDLNFSHLKGGPIIEAAPSNTWISIGNNSQTLVLTPPNNGDYRDFKLRCIVTDAWNTTKTSNEHYVYVHNSPPPQGLQMSQLNGEMKEGLFKNSRENSKTENETLPEEYSLEQNYPNPFNPSTIISYSIPGNEFVTLKIYDMLGKEISTLVNERRAAGKYSVEFNASNLPSGTYIYKLTTGNYSLSKKMSFIK